MHVLFISSLLQLDYGDSFSIVINGSGVVVALWILSAIVGAIDSIPLVFYICFLNFKFFLDLVEIVRKAFDRFVSLCSLESVH